MSSRSIAPYAEMNLSLLESKQSPKYPIGANGFTEPPSHRPLSTSLMDESVTSQGPAPRGLTDQDAEASDQKQASQVLDGTIFVPPRMDPIKDKTFKEKLHRKWDRLRDLRVIDPNFSHLPRGLSTYIDPKKDPFRDKVRRLRRLKWKSAAPVPLDQLPQQYPDPIYWPSLVTNADPPRLAPAVKQQMFFGSAGPALDIYENPYGGEHSVLHENEKDREERNQATQRDRTDRELSDRFLARRRQRHINNYIIGRAPPLRKRYIREEMRRIAWRTNETPRVVVEPQDKKLRVAAEPQVKTPSVIEPQDEKPQVVVELQAKTPSLVAGPQDGEPGGQDFSLPKVGARAFQWDRAMLSKKSVPQFQAQKETDEEHCHPVSLEIPTEGTIPGKDIHQTGKDDLKCEAHIKSNGSDTTALAAEEMTKAGTTAESTDPVSLSRAGLPLASEGIGAILDNQSNCGSSNYCERSVSEDSYHANNSIINNAEHHADVYRQEIESLRASKLDGYPPTNISSLSKVPTPIAQSQFPKHHHTPEAGDFEMNITTKHTKPELGNGLVSSANGMTMEAETPCIGAGKGGLSNSTTSSPKLLNLEHQKQKTHYRLPPTPKPSLELDIQKSGNSATLENHPQTHTLNSRAIKAESQYVKHSPHSPQYGYRGEMERMQGKFEVQSPATLRGLGHQPSNNAPWSTSINKQTMNPFSRQQKSQIPRINQNTQPPQTPMLRNDYSAARPPQKVLREQYSSRRLAASLIKDDWADNAPLTQEGPYPMMPRRNSPGNSPGIEGLARPSRQTAAMARPCSSQETQERVKHFTQDGNGSPFVTKRPLGFPPNSTPVNCQEFGSPVGRQPVITGNRRVQSDLTPFREGQQAGIGHSRIATSKQFSKRQAE